MYAKDIISEEIPALRTSDSGATAINWMEIFRVSHLPIVNSKEFLGLISDTDIYDLNMAEEPIGNHHLSLFKPYVLQHQHIYNVLEVASRLQLSVVPVLNENKHYLGVITITDLMHYFAELGALKNPGGIIVLELNIRDYSMTEISQIIEGNDAKILSVYITSLQNSTQLDVTIKINHADITSIVQTFERYNYTIKASFMENNVFDNFMEDRYQSLLKYLSI